MTPRGALLGAALALLAGAAGSQTLEPNARIQLADARALAFAPDGKSLAALSRDGVLRLVALPGGGVLRTVPAEGARAIAFAPDGRSLATATSDGTVNVVPLAGAGAVRTLATGLRHIDALALSPDGSALAVMASGVPVELWDLGSGLLRARATPEFAGSQAMAFSPDGTLLATADEDTRVRVYSTHSGALLATAEDLLLEPLAIDFTPDGKALVVGGADKALTVLEPRTGRVVRRLPPQADPVGGIAVLASGRALVGYFHADHMSAPAPLLSWNLETGDSKVMASEYRVFAAGLTRDRRLLLASRDGQDLVVSTVK